MKTKRPVIMGIYGIRDTLTDGIIYVGKSSDIYKRWTSHKSTAPRDVDNYSHHEFFILEVVEDARMLDEREDYYIMLHMPKRNRRRGDGVRMRAKSAGVRYLGITDTKLLISRKLRRQSLLSSQPPR